jgi:acyl-CoA synthetase (AMP-forming)/AMP-acid ligase II
MYAADHAAASPDKPAVVVAGSGEVLTFGEYEVVPNEDLGEEVKAVVQPLDGVEGGAGLEAELQEFCRAHLARVKCPRSVDFVDELPRLPTGKLYKSQLRQQYRDAARA